LERGCAFYDVVLKLNLGGLCMQLRVYGTPIKAAAQPAVERVAAPSSASPAPAAPVPASSLPEETQEKVAPVDIEGESGMKQRVLTGV
jgi:hypothetical protein